MLGPVDHIAMADGPANEDLIGWEGQLAWVIDGATSLAEHQVTDRPSDALWLVEHLSTGLRSRAQSSDDLAELLAESIADVADRAGAEWIGTPEVPPSAAVGIVRFNEMTTDFLVLADVSVVLRTEAGTVEICDERVDTGNEIARMVMQEELERTGDLTAARERVAPMLLERRRTSMNQPEGYWVAALDPDAAVHAVSGTFERVHEVVLATDGFVRCLRPLGLFRSWEHLLQSGYGLGAIARMVRQRESDDTFCKDFPRWNTHDDLAAARWRIS